MLQDGQAELIALVKIDDVGIIPILTVCLKEKLRFSPLVVSGKDLLWDASKSFIGDSTPKFRVSFYEKGVIKHTIDINETIDDNYKSRCFSLSKLEIGVYDITVDLLKEWLLWKSPFAYLSSRLYSEISIKFVLRASDCASKRLC